MNTLADHAVIVYAEDGSIARESFGRVLSPLEKALCDALDKRIADPVPVPTMKPLDEGEAKAWAKLSDLRCVELGGRMHAQPGYETVDTKGADVICDLNQNWPFDDSSVGVIRAADVFEHLHDPIYTMQECYRVLAPGGIVFMQVPSTDGRGAFQDPTHRSWWNENSLLYFTDARWAQYIDCPVMFRASMIRTTAPDARGVCWVQAHLVSLKT